MSDIIRGIRLCHFARDCVDLGFIKTADDFFVICDHPFQLRDLTIFKKGIEPILRVGTWHKIGLRLCR